MSKISLPVLPPFDVGMSGQVKFAYSQYALQDYAEHAVREALAAQTDLCAAKERDAKRYRVLRNHTAPMRLSESMGITSRQVKRAGDVAAVVDEMCDAVIDVDSSKENGNGEPS